MTRFWPEGQSIDVNTCTELTHGQENHGLVPDEIPDHFSWHQSEHRIEEILEIWRIDIDWWRTQKWRTYFRLITNTGLLVIIYQDLVNEKWFLQRLYD